MSAGGGNAAAAVLSEPLLDRAVDEPHDGRGLRHPLAGAQQPQGVQSRLDQGVRRRAVRRMKRHRRVLGVPVDPERAASHTTSTAAELHLFTNVAGADPYHFR